MTITTAAAGQTPRQDSDSSSDFDAPVEINIQSGEPVRIQRHDHQQANIKIDGRLDEPVWAGIPAFDEFKVVEPDTLASTPYATEFRIFYTEKGVYASYNLEQPHDTIIRRFMARDDFDVRRDNAGFTLDTSGDGRYGYWVNLSVGDVQRDGTILPERQFNSEWDGAWTGATQTTDRGWSSEFFLPWSQMAMPKKQGVRRIGLYGSRIVAHLNERWAFPALPNSQPKFMSVLQPLEFEGVDPRRQWSLFPYASSTYDRIDDNVRYKVGLDFFWRPSSNLQLTATANPDFGSVEADDVIVNLTADETFFPEKRLFFLEGQDIFNTTPRAEANFGLKFAIVNTRRIGARPRSPVLPAGISLPTREQVRPSDLLGATKATGQFGPFRYGVLAALEDESKFVANNLLFFQDGRDFGTLRVLYEDDHGAAYRGLGFISTIVAHPEADAMVHGIDFHRLSTSGVWNIDGQFIYSDRDESGSGLGGYVDFEFRPQQGIKHVLQLTAFDDGLDVNDLGFQVRNNIRDFRYAFEWVKSDLSWARDFESSTFVRYVENGDGLRTNMGLGPDITITFKNLHSIDLNTSYFFDRFDDRNSFGNGTFQIESGATGGIGYETNSAKPISFFASAEYRSEAAGGYSLEGEAGISWRPSHNVNLNFEAGYKNRNGWLLHQEDRNFTTFNSIEWQPEMSLDYFPSAKQQFRLALQWVGIRAREDEFYTLPSGSTTLVRGPKPPGPTDNFNISELSFQLRYRWQIAPLSDLFVVYTRGDSRETSADEFDDLFRNSWNMPLGDQLVVKLRYRFGS